MASPSGIMQIRVPVIPNRNAHLHKNIVYVGLDTQHYSMAVSSYGWSAMAEQSPQMPPRGEWQQLQNIHLSSWLIKNRLVQASTSARCPRRKLLLTKNHRHSRLPLPREQRAQMKGTSVLQ